MRKCFAFILVLGCILNLTGCKKEQKQFDITGASSIYLYSGLTGDSVNVTDAEGIKYITDNINSLLFEKGKSHKGENGYAYSIRWYDADHTLLTDLIVMDEYTVVYDGYYYSGMEADYGIDTGFFAQKLEEKYKEPIPDAPADTWGITMTAEKVTPASLKLVIAHSGKAPAGELGTGSLYWVEVRNGDVWNRLPEVLEEDGVERVWNSIAYLIPANDSFEDQVNFGWLYGELPAGQYRIGKEIFLDHASGGRDEQIYYAEFEIQ